MCAILLAVFALQTEEGNQIFQKRTCSKKCIKIKIIEMDKNSSVLR